MWCRTGGELRWRGKSDESRGRFEKVPSWELTYPTWGKENNLQKLCYRGYISSLEESDCGRGNPTLKWPHFKGFLSFRVGEVLKFVQMNKI